MQTNHPLKGFDFYATDIHMPPDLEAEISENGIIATMRKNAMFRDARDHDIMAAFERGELKHSTIIKPTLLVAQNKLVDGFFTDLFSRYDATSGVNQTLEFKYLGIGTRSGVAFDDGQTQLDNEIYRFAPTERYNDTSRKFYFSRYITNAEGNMTATTVAAGTWTTTNFDLTSATGIAQYDALEIYTSADGLYTNVTITAKSGVNVTVSPALAAVPVATDIVTRLYGEIGIFMNPATATLNSAKMADRAVTYMKKDGGKLINAVFNHLAV